MAYSISETLDFKLSISNYKVSEFSVFGNDSRIEFIVFILELMVLISFSNFNPSVALYALPSGFSPCNL